MTQRAKRIYGIGGGTGATRLATGVIMWGLFAVFFIGFGVAPLFRGRQLEWFPLAFGILSAIVAAVAFKRSRESGIQC
jgi:hypothetical protein